MAGATAFRHFFLSIQAALDLSAAKDINFVDFGNEGVVTVGLVLLRLFE